MLASGNVDPGVMSNLMATFGDDQEARDYIKRRQGILATPPGAIEVSQARQNEQAALSAQNVGNLTPEQIATSQNMIGGEAPVDVKQALLSSNNI
jgi:hypothetical protein